jgi:gamma-glutamyl:cysteine ligase YbdK (ATP-grasp superfamily)
MNVFDPKTYSTDWELLVVDKLDRCVSHAKLEGFAGQLRSELDLPIQTDFNAIEFAMGICKSFKQMQDRIQLITDRATQLLAEYDLDLFPCAAHPVDFMYSCSHVHVGTIHNETDGICMENRLMKYIPVFVALSANSPVAHGLRGQFKSYRVRNAAHWCVHPIDCRNPHTTQPDWGRDCISKLYSAPTFEVRVADCASSRRLLGELVTFIAAYTHHLGSKNDECSISPDDYKDYLTNRWSAARYGLQATLAWDGKPKPVIEILDKMLDECSDSLRDLGANRSDFPVMQTMLEKRVCQADFVSNLAERYSDNYQLASVYGKLVRQWDIFEEYLESTKPLDIVPMADEDAIIAEHLSHIGESTYFYSLRTTMWYPAPIADELLDRMVDLGLVRREISPNRGTLLHREVMGSI